MSPRRLFRLPIRRPDQTATEIDDEITFHLQERVDQLTARGYTPYDARAEAHRRFGDPALARQRLVASAQRREDRMQLRERLNAIGQDVRYALRGVARRPAFALITVLTLALGIGANTTVFTWMEGLVLNPLPAVRDANSLVALTTGTPSGGTQSISYPDYLDWRSQSRTLRDIVVYRQQQLSLRTSAAAQAQPVWGVLVSANYFDVLGLNAVRGRTFRSDESAPDATAGSAPVVVLGYALWQRQFGGRDDVIGETLWLDSHPMTIIGVVPPGFHGTNVGFGFDLWAPITMEPTLLAQPAAKLTWRRSRWLHAFARLAPGSSLPQARTELAAIGARLAAAYPEDKDTGPAITPLFDTEAPGILRPVFLALLGATGLVLLIVCFDLAGLQLVRATAKQHELAVRLALGAGRGRIVQQFLIEVTLLALLGVPAALATARWARGLLIHFLTHSTFPLAVTPGFDAHVFAFTGGAVLLVLLFVGLWPALRASHTGPWSALRAGGDRSATGLGRTRELLVIAQLALSLIAVACAGLFVHSLEQLRSTPTGLLDPEHVLLASTDFDLAGTGYAGFDDDVGVRARRLAVAAALIEHARALPGVRDVALTDTPPLGLITGFDSFDTEVLGYTPKPGEPMSFQIAYATPTYWSTIGPPLVRGRSFRDTDRDGAPFVAVVNEAFARRFWPRPDPASAALGQQLRIGSRTLTVVGVVRDTKYHYMSEPPLPFIYLSYAQWSPTALTIALRTTGDPMQLVGPLRKIFHDVDPALPFLDPRTLADQIDGALTIQRLGATLLTGLGALALAIAGLGLYGVLAHAVLQRRREIGIRMALGAQATDILHQFAMRGLAIACAGIALAVPGVLVAGRLLRSQLYGVGPTDPLALGTTAALFAGIVLAASLLTALRATRVDPARATREE